MYVCTHGKVGLFSFVLWFDANASGFDANAWGFFVWDSGTDAKNAHTECGMLLQESRHAQQLTLGQMDFGASQCLFLLVGLSCSRVFLFFFFTMADSGIFLACLSKLFSYAFK